MKPFAKKPPGQQRNPLPTDILVRDSRATGCNARTKLSALRGTAASPGLVVAALLFALLTATLTTYAAVPTLEVPVEAWVKRYGISVVTNGNALDQAVKVVSDAHGDIIVTGSTSSGADTDPFTSEKIVAIKYSGSDGSVVWSRRYDSPTGREAVPADMAVDSSGNVAVIACSRGVVGSDIYTAKYAAADGALLWEKQFDSGANSYDFPSAVAVDGSGNVILTGISEYGTNPDFYTAKYAAADGALLWERRYDGPAHSYDGPSALAVDASGNVVVTGSSCGTNSDCDYYTAKYAADDGTLLWEKRFNGPANGYDSIPAVVLDAGGNVVMTGNSLGTNSGYDYYTAKYAAANGALLWERRFNGLGNGFDSPSALAVDDLGNVVVTGSSCSNNFDCDYYTAKYAADDGALLWERRFNGPANAMALDLSGNVVVTGYSSVANHCCDLYTAKYAAADGALLWEKRFNLLPLGYPLPALAVDVRGNVVVTGSSCGTNASCDFYTVKYASTDGAVLWEQRHDGPAYGGIYIDRGGPPPARAVAIDPNNNVVVIGNRIRDGQLFLYTAKYAATDGSLLWEQRYNGVETHAMAVDFSGNVIVTAYSSSFDGERFRTVKYAAADGAVLWEVEQGGNAIAVDQSGIIVLTGNRTTKLAAEDGALLWEQGQGGFAVAVDQNGNVVVNSGSYLTKYAAEGGALLWGTSPPGGFNLRALALDADGNVAVTGASGYTAKYAAVDGALLWERRSRRNDQGNAIAVDTGGNVVVMGAYGSGVLRTTTVYAAKYAAADGTLLWEQRYGPSDHDVGIAVAVDSAGNVVVTGYTDTNDPCFKFCSPGPGDCYTVKYAAADGRLLWEQRYNGPAGGDDFIIGDQVLALGPDDSIVITGLSDGNPGSRTAYELATVKYVMTQVTFPTPIMLSLAVSPDGARLRFTGDDGRTYRLQRASNPAGPWITFTAVTAPVSGAVEHLDPAPLVSPAFYRVTAP